MNAHLHCQYAICMREGASLKTYDEDYDALFPGRRTTDGCSCSSLRRALYRLSAVSVHSEPIVHDTL